MQKGRGANSNRESRFHSQKMETDLSDYGWRDEDEKTLLKTQVFKDSSKTIITENKSPDIGFRYSMNFYRGCEHGCAYCYARPTHEYLGLSAGLDFESKIFVKEKGPELLREKLMSPSWKPEIVVMSGVTDCYQPLERKYQLTRQALEIMLEFKNPVGLITKNNLIVRDADILEQLAKENLVVAYISITTLNADLGRELEPRTSSPQGRLKAIEELSKRGVPIGVNLAPMIPGLTDHEIPEILKAARDAGAKYAGMTPLRLPYSVKDIFSQWLDDHRPDSKAKVLSYLQDIRGGKLNDSQFGSRMTGEGPRAENMHKMFDLFYRKYGFGEEKLELATEKFRRPTKQLSFF